MFHENKKNHQLQNVAVFQVSPGGFLLSTSSSCTVSSQESAFAKWGQRTHNAADTVVLSSLPCNTMGNGDVSKILSFLSARGSGGSQKELVGSNLHKFHPFQVS